MPIATTLKKRLLAPSSLGVVPESVWGEFIIAKNLSQALACANLLNTEGLKHVDTDGVYINPWGTLIYPDPRKSIIDPNGFDALIKDPNALSITNRDPKIAGWGPKGSILQEIFGPGRFFQNLDRQSGGLTGDQNAWKGLLRQTRACLKHIAWQNSSNNPDRPATITHIYDLFGFPYLQEFFGIEANYWKIFYHRLYSEQGVKLDRINVIGITGLTREPLRINPGR